MLDWLADRGHHTIVVVVAVVINYDLPARSTYLLLHHLHLSIDMIHGVDEGKILCFSFLHQVDQHLIAAHSCRLLQEAETPIREEKRGGREEEVEEEEEEEEEVKAWLEGLI